MNNILTLFLLMISLSVFGQLDRAYMLQVATYNSSRDTWIWGEAQTVNLRFTMETNHVKIDDENGTQIWTYEDLGKKSGYDDDGDAYSKHVWNAYDEKNRKCRFTMLWYTSGVKLVTYTIQYSDFAFRYYISTKKEIL